MKNAPINTCIQVFVRMYFFIYFVNIYRRETVNNAGEPLEELPDCYPN